MMIRIIAAVFAMAASCGAVTAGISSKAEALCAEAETGNPLHIVREGQGERPVLAIHNAAQEKIAAQGTLKVEGFVGDVIDLPVDIALDAGQTIKIPVQRCVLRAQGFRSALPERYAADSPSPPRRAAPRPSRKSPR